MSDREELRREGIRVDWIRVRGIGGEQIIEVEAAAEHTRYQVVCVRLNNSDWLVAVPNLTEPFVGVLPTLGGWHYSYLERFDGRKINQRTAMALRLILDMIEEELAV